MVATTYSSLLNAEPDRCHTLGGLASTVRSQADEYFRCKPYQLHLNTWLDKQIGRLPATDKGSDASRQKSYLAKFPNVMNEDELFTLSNNMIYRQNVLKHATRYKNFLISGNGWNYEDYEDCENCNIEQRLSEYTYHNLTLGSETCTRKERARRSEQRCGELYRVRNLVDEADLYEASFKPFESHREPKGVMYLTLVVLANRRGGRAENQIARLKSVRHDVCRANILVPDRSIG